MKDRRAVAFVAAGLAVAGAVQQPALAQTSTAEGIAQYRALLADGNPADLWEAKGEAIWKQKRGPKNASLEACDLGKGPGVVKGAFVELPRWFADTQRVQDLESRLLTCLQVLQGFDAAEIAATPFGKGEQLNIESLVTYVSAASNGMKFNLPQAHLEERRMLEAGKKIFFFRAGPYDFACASCHGEAGKRIRLQDLPNLTVNPGDGVGFAAWPAYRVSSGELWSMQRRLNDCYRQQRFPYPGYASDATIALGVYMGVQAGAQSPLRRRSGDEHHMSTQHLTAFALAAAVALVTACTTAHTTAPNPADADRLAQEILKSSFREQGIAKLDRLTQDDVQKACSAETPPTEAVAKQLEAAQLAAVQWPADGVYLGDWREGEKLAQNGRGGTWSDPAGVPAGGNCYNCHQITKAEISFGTIGPSLYQYGRLRGVTNPADPASEAIVKYTWGKLWNAKAYNACSGMPRFGHAGLLTPAQIKDLMALLLDPKSPVNAQ